MKNIKISFNEEENNIKYEEYILNGLPIPKDIKISLKLDSLKISWNIEDFKLLDNKHIKLEIRKENNNKYISIYEGNDNNNTINNLEKNKNYKIRLCSIYNNKIYKIIINYFNRLILGKNERKNDFFNKILEWTGVKGLELINRGTKMV